MLAAVLLPVAAGVTSCVRVYDGGNAPAPPDVEVAVVEQKDLPIEREWIGTLDGMVNAAIKAQVNGYLLTQNYTEGSFVRKGQLLFEIDPRPFQAAVDQAEGQLAQATRQLAKPSGIGAGASATVRAPRPISGRRRLDEDRYVPLAKQQAITQQDLDNAKQTNQSHESASGRRQGASGDHARRRLKPRKAGVTAQRPRWKRRMSIWVHQAYIAHRRHRRCRRQRR